MTSIRVSESQIAQFREDGFLLVENLFDREEADILFRFARDEMNEMCKVPAAIDLEGKEIKLWGANEAEGDVYDAFIRNPRLVGTMESLMDDEVCLYHYKMMVKDAHVGGAWAWHQDYNYWYDYGYLYPDMASAIVAIGPAHRDNGCLQVLKGSHKLGRIDHGRYGHHTQIEVDPRRLSRARDCFENVYCEMEPGTVFFFHANLLHGSGANTSSDPRWSLICCYNTKHNPGDILPDHPSYRRLVKLPDSRIKELGRARLKNTKYGKDRPWASSGSYPTP